MKLLTLSNTAIAISFSNPTTLSKSAERMKSSNVTNFNLYKAKVYIKNIF